MKQPIILRVQTKNKDTVVHQAANALREGFLAILPTETVYGLAAYPAIPGAEEKIFAAKSRDKNKQIPLLAFLPSRPGWPMRSGPARSL